MTTKSRLKEMSLIDLYLQFIDANKRGKRLQPNGNRLSSGTITNYIYTLNLLRSFSSEKSFELRIRPVRYLTTRQLETEKNYWRKFYKRFTDYLYNDCGHFDNYVGQTMKNVRVFFNYLNKGLTLGVGDFHKSFYVRKEQIPIFPLMPHELNFLINNKKFEASLTRRMIEAKDFFVFGCTVALRLSDLLNLKKSNLKIVNDQQYLVVRSVKTKVDTLIKLPQYATEIIAKYSTKRKLLPVFNKSNLNTYIKRLLEKAGLTQPVQKLRERRGMTVELKSKMRYPFLRLCDIASSHTMRRTAITTMLSLGVPEQIVRKVSGHSPASRDFYRYVAWSQTIQDQEMERGFAHLQKMSSAMDNADS